MAIIPFSFPRLQRALNERPSSLTPVINDPESNCALALVVAEALKNLERVPPAEGLNHIAVSTTRKLLKGIPKEKSQDPRIARCRREFLAFKLGVTSKVFDENPEFEKFASNPPLERYLAGYGHTLRESSDGKLEILEGGDYRPWKEVKHIPNAPENKNPSYQPWFYGPKGVQNQDMFQWEKLPVYKKEEPRNRYIFEICCCCEKDPRRVGDHSWLRLIDPEGNTYSVGKYRPYKSDPQKGAKDPMRVQKGLLMSPDVSEFWPTPIHTIPIEISKKEFETMKRTIEEDNASGLTFQLIDNNCTRYVEKIARIAGIRLPGTEKPYWRFLAPKMEGRIDGVTPWVPSSAQKIVSGLAAAVFQTVLCCYGARRVDQQVKTPQKPFISTPGELFNSDRLEIAHPHNVANKTRGAVLQWRENEARRLQYRERNPENDVAAIARAIEDVRYALPNSMRIRNP